LQETERTLSNEKENYESQLQLLQQRGMLQSSEIKKISELNAELFGHSNSRQKIKHVAQLKEENVHLKEVDSFNVGEFVFISRKGFVQAETHEYRTRIRGSQIISSW
jgi:hypothetical protein